MSIRRSLSLLLSIAAILFAACSSDSGPPTSDVVSQIPWSDDESLTYVLLNPGGEVLGESVLSVMVLDGETVLSQAFTGEKTTDAMSVLVESDTLKPLSSTREIVAEDDEVLIEVTYTEDGALIRQDDEKQTGISVPEHSYDNDSSLFLWRTLDFNTDFEASYNTIITNQRDRHKVNLSVSRRETVTVPAGEFSAWRLEIETSNADQVAWIADTPERTLLRYDNSRGVIYELQSLPE